MKQLIKMSWQLMHPRHLGELGLNLVTSCCGRQTAFGGPHAVGWGEGPVKAIRVVVGLYTNNTQYIFDYWADPVVHIHSLKSSMLKQTVLLRFFRLFQRPFLQRWEP